MRPKGLEPPAHCLEGSCSIHLSYGRTLLSHWVPLWRQLLSAAVLAMVWMYFYPKAGWAMVGITVLICIGRVLTGVHHIRDVVGGAVLGFALGYAGMWLL